MSSYQTDRGKFIEALRAEGVPEVVSLAVLRDANTVQRLAVDDCNGVADPVHWLEYDTPEGRKLAHELRRKPIAGAAATFACGPLSDYSEREPFSKSRRDRVTCPNCRSTWAERRIAARLAEFKVTPIFGGDPRGCCVKLRVPSGRTDDWGREGLCVPTRGY